MNELIESCAMMEDIMSGYTVKFGRHKGKTLAYVRENDAQYLDWLYKQPWLKTRYPEIRAYMLAVFTPEWQA